MKGAKPPEDSERRITPDEEERSDDEEGVMRSEQTRRVRRAVGPPNSHQAKLGAGGGEPSLLGPFSPDGVSGRIPAPAARQVVANKGLTRELAPEQGA